MKLDIRKKIEINKITKSKYADLHLHTNFSDGKLSPEQIVLKAKCSGLSAIAITDHDTIDGLDPAIREGKKYNIEIIPGIELSAETDAEEVHILGFFVDCYSQDLRNKINELVESRRKRIIMMIDNLSDIGIKLEYETVLNNINPVSIGRPHLAYALVEKGYVSTISEAFDKFLNSNSPIYIAKQKLYPAEAIKIIIKAGGIPVLAHPGYLQQNMLDELVSFGLMGLEAFHPCLDIQISNYYCELAKKYNLLITGGSDYHGFSESKISIGKIRLPYKYIEDMKKLINNDLSFLKKGVLFL